MDAHKTVQRIVAVSDISVQLRKLAGLVLIFFKVLVVALMVIALMVIASMIIPLTAIGSMVAALMERMLSLPVAD